MTGIRTDVTAVSLKGGATLRYTGKGSQKHLHKGVKPCRFRPIWTDCRLRQ